MDVNDLNSALKAFNKIEDARDELRAKYNEKDKKLKDALAQVEAFLLEQMKALNLSAFEAPGEGVATIKTVRHFGVADWGVFWEWVVETKNPHMLQKRLLDSEVDTYLELNGGLPPAVNTRAKLEVKVTKRPK